MTFDSFPAASSSASEQRAADDGELRQVAGAAAPKYLATLDEPAALTRTSRVPILAIYLWEKSERSRRCDDGTASLWRPRQRLIVGSQLYSLPAGYAPAAPGSARADPTRATPTITSSSPTIRPFDDRGCVHERMDASGSAELVLRARLQSRSCQRECRCSQSYRDFPHKTFLPVCQDAEVHATT